LEQQQYVLGFWEKGSGLREGYRDLPKAMSGKSITAGVVAAIFGCTGPAIIVISSAQAAGYSFDQIVSWLFGIYVFGGLISLICAPYYKMPVVGSFAIPGAVLMGSALVGFSFNEAVFGFLGASLIIAVLAMTGMIGKVMRIIPQPIVMAMIVGSMLRFGTGMATSVVQSPIIAGSAVLAFFIVPRIIKKMSPVISALVVGVIVAIATGGFTGDAQMMQYVPPQIVAPHFNPAVILAVSVPLAIISIGSENAQAYGVLKAQGYKPPVNAMNAICGLLGFIANLFGAHNLNLAGPMTAICASPEGGDDPKNRYAAAWVNGLVFGSFGLVASFALAFIGMVPAQLIAMLAGLAMINVLLNALTEAFKHGKCKLGAFFALVIAASGITVLNIGAAFWALLIGVSISVFFERADFVSLIESKSASK